MEYRVDLAGNVPEKAAEGAAALRDEGAAAKGATHEIQNFKASVAAIEATTKAVHGLTEALKEIHGTKVAPFSNARDEDFGRSKWETPPPKAAAPSPELGKATDGAQRAGSATKGAGSALKGVFGDAAGAIGKAALATVAFAAAMAGVHGFADLARMAIGWRTLGQLQMVSFKATMDLRRAVAGVDAQPLVRAATRFERNLSQSTVTGKALSGILTRGFNALFGAVEKLEPIFERVFQKAVLGALRAEGAWLDLRIAAFPITEALEQWAPAAETVYKLFDAMPTPLSAVRDILQDINDLRIAAGEHSGNADESLYHKVTKASAGAAENARASELGDAVWENGAAPKEKSDNVEPMKASGKAIGKALGDGMKEGMDASGSDVETAGRTLGGRAVAGARDEVGAHSPADATIELGHDLGDGNIVGMRQRAGAVQAEAERSLVPNVSAPKGNGAAGAAAGASLTVQGPLAQIVVQGGGANVDDLVAQFMARAPDVMQEALRIALARLGIGLVGAT